MESAPPRGELAERRSVPSDAGEKDRSSRPTGNPQRPSESYPVIRVTRSVHADTTPALTKSSASSSVRAAARVPIVFGRATTTMSNPPRAREPTLRQASFSRRLQRLRRTAPPRARPHTKPTRMPCSQGRTYSTIHSPDRRRPSFSTARNSPLVRRTVLRAAAVSPRFDQADSWARPFRRRRARMARPPRVRIRARNPWVLLRLRLLGWYVCFTSSIALESSGHRRSHRFDRFGPSIPGDCWGKRSPRRASCLGEAVEGGAIMRGALETGSTSPPREPGRRIPQLWKVSVDNDAFAC